MAIEQLLFTDWPRGKGVDSAAAGFQIKACSKGLGNDIRRQLADSCMHLGRAFTPASAPRAAAQQEQEWLVQTQDRQAMPAEILAEFPLIWSYDRLADERYALIRATYLGLTHDGRTGNFLAHALVFAPAELASYGYNPLALARSELFQSTPTDTATDLPILSDLGNSIDPGPHYDALRAEPYYDRLAALSTALCTATPVGRPLLLCLSDWRQATPLLEGLLDLLPPSRRCRTTFVTYESDRYWLPSSGTGRPVGVAAHQILVLCGEDSRAFNLRADEYQSGYMAFNFAENRFSELREPGGFAVFAARCVLEQRSELLAAQHDLLEKLNLTEAPDAWDRLATITNPGDSHITPAMLTETARFAVSLVRQPPQAKSVLDFFLPHLQTLRETNQSAALAALGQELVVLIDRCDENKAALIRDLVARLPATTCPDANARLNLRLLQITQPQGEALLQTLTEITAAGARADHAQEIMAELLPIVRQSYSQAQELAVALGRMAEAAYGTAVQETLLTAYQEALQQAPSRQDQIRRKLAGAGAVQVLCHELLAEVLPWKAEDSSRLQHWDSMVLRQHPQLLDTLCRQVADRMAKPIDREAILPLAQKLLSRGSKQAEAGFAALYNATILGLPLQPLGETWKQALATLPPGLSQAAESRRRILRFLGQLQRRAGEPDWSILQFPHTDPAWESDVRSLNAMQQAQVLAWCIDTFTSTGVTTAEEATRLTGLLAAIGKTEPDDIAGAVQQLLAGRDPVTEVLVAMAFVQSALSDPGAVGQTGKNLAAILKRFDSATRRLFEEHLQHRFCPPGQQKRLEPLLLATGLLQVESPPLVGKPEDTTRATEQPHSAGHLFSTIKQGLRNIRDIWSSSETAAKSSNRRTEKHEDNSK
ncbi:MAG: hypothetical protein U1F76_19855 [Candidatus Competibacteraceae bacterium]